MPLYFIQLPVPYCINKTKRFYCTLKILLIELCISMNDWSYLFIYLHIQWIAFFLIFHYMLGYLETIHTENSFHLTHALIKHFWRPDVFYVIPLVSTVLKSTAWWSNTIWFEWFELHYMHCSIFKSRKICRMCLRMYY